MPILLAAKELVVELQHKTLFKELSVSIARGDRIGLVGKNGEGKSTLLKILAGELEPTSGRVVSSARVHYLPQLDLTLFERADTVADLVASRNAELSLVQAALRRLFYLSISPEREVRTLSGGELAKLLIAIGDADNPDLLLLDEPTNHLDVEGLEVLKRYLLKFQGAFVVVSHDPFFLDHAIASLWEIEDGCLTRYGGNYSYYQEQRRLADEARGRDLEAATKSLNKARRAIEVRETRVARATRASRRAKSEPSRDKFAEGFFQGKAEEGAGRLKKRQEKALAEKQEKISNLTKKKVRKVHLDLETESDLSKRMLVNVSGGVLSVADTPLLQDISLRIEFGDRVVFTGGNGVGKSSLAKTLALIPGPASLLGTLRRGERFQAVYMDQKYQSVRPKLSVLQNILEENSAWTEEDARNHLGRFLFREEAVMKKAEVLSGGETARLALALVTSRPLDLLVLDEPTNNLDIETLEIIAAALQDFRGALIVISHNVRFLAQLGIGRAYKLADGRLRLMKHLPQEEEEFYAELAGEVR
ncbi:ATP-binding cassette domain-containing protein [Candidatus Parcubacteria bacterium]|nr:ATP-binding cassette domain-containing protein [Candidatus Parcubacteria bacterium]